MSENSKTAQRILDEIQKVVVGKTETVEKILMAILAGGHILMEDVPGVGKTTFGLHFLASGGREGERGLHFGFFETPRDLAAWLSVRDAAELLRASVEADLREVDGAPVGHGAGFVVANGTSAGERPGRRCSASPTAWCPTSV